MYSSISNCRGMSCPTGSQGLICTLHQAMFLSTVRRTVCLEKREAQDPTVSAKPAEMDLQNASTILKGVAERVPPQHAHRSKHKRTPSAILFYNRGTVGAANGGEALDSFPAKLQAHPIGRLLSIGHLSAQPPVRQEQAWSRLVK
jgi:hypothetical protein